MAGVVLEHITKRFGDLVTVKDLNLDIKDQEFLVLVGPSGCGKSTTLRMIAGLEEISGGDVADQVPRPRTCRLVLHADGCCLQSDPAAEAAGNGRLIEATWGRKPGRCRKLPDQASGIPRKPACQC